MKPYYERDGIAIYHGDCREIAPSLKADAVVSDPPYGMAWDPDSSRFTGGMGHDRIVPTLPVSGDDGAFDPTPWLHYAHVVLWGSHHYSDRLPPGTWLVWLKKPPHRFGTFLGDADLAWSKGGGAVYSYLHEWSGMSRATERGEFYHPTQKPVGLMRWCMERLDLAPGAVVLDPFMGSGTTLVAARDLGRKAVGIEIEERYCEIAAKRLAQQVFPMEPA